MTSASFELKIYVPGLNDSELWQGARGGTSANKGELGVNGDEELQGSALLYLPFIHYLKTSAKEDKSRITGQAGEDGLEWVKGEGPAVIDFKLEFISEGHLEVKGQWARWHYPLRNTGGREIYLKLKR